MRLLEYQAKELFKEYNINIPDSISSTDIEKGRKDAKKIGYPFVIKAQVPVWWTWQSWWNSKMP